MERKLLASKFLGYLANMFYMVGGQDIPENKPFASFIQELFLPYLQSNSLYQRLGAACILCGWAKNFRMHITESEPIVEPPPVVVAHLLQCLQNHSNIYSETASAISRLTSECNEFQNYCVRRGVPRQELSDINTATDIKDVIQ
jgi:hypothetical protein